MKGIFRDILRFLIRLFSRFIEHRSITNAASLTYVTLLSLVPMLTVVFAVISAFPVADRVGGRLRDFIFQSFVPAAGQAVQQHIEGFIDKASQLSGASFVVLIVIALMLMVSIDKALNTIWETHRKRGSVQKFLVYWALISLGPLLLAISLAGTSYLVSLPFMMEAEESLHIGSRLILFAPVLSAMIAFSLMYLIIPNHTVPVRYAVAGGLVAAVLFDLANRGFGFYVTSFTSYQAIYGALAVIPIFLVWIFLSWVIFLFGAEFAHCLERCPFSDEEETAPQSELETAVGMLNAVRTMRHEGELMPEETLLEMSADYGGLDEGGLLRKLSEVNLLVKTEKEKWTLGRSLGDISLMELYSWLDCRLPPSARGKPDWALSASLDKANRQIAESFALSLDEILGCGSDIKKKAGD